MSREEILSRAELIRPLKRENGSLFYAEKVDPIAQSFLLSNPTPEIAENLSRVCELKTLHSYISPTIFEPTFADVVQQIPKELLADICAFEVIYAGFDEDNTHHVAVTRLYSDKGNRDATIEYYSGSPSLSKARRDGLL